MAPWLSATPEGSLLRHLRVYALWPAACRQPDGGERASQGAWIRRGFSPGFRWTDFCKWHHPSFAAHLPPQTDAGGCTRTKAGGQGQGRGRPCVILISGGGYNINAPIFEGHLAAEYFCRAHGAVCLVVRYRVATGGWDAPAGLADCGRMLSLAHANAEAWGIDRSRIAVFGASAGGSVAVNLLAAAADGPHAGVALPAVHGAYLAAGIDPAGIQLEASCLLLLYPWLDMVTTSGGYERLIKTVKVLGSGLSEAAGKARATLMSPCELQDGGKEGHLLDGSEEVSFLWPDAKLSALPPTAAVVCDGDGATPACAKAFVARLNTLHREGDSRGGFNAAFAEYTELTFGKDVKSVHAFALEEWSHELLDDAMVAKGYKVRIAKQADTGLMNAAQS